MTISYSGAFFHLIFRWYGSIWRSIYKELSVFLILYFLVRIVYTFVIPLWDEDGTGGLKIQFESLCKQFDVYTKNIPLTFLLGFYVSNVVSRWWRQFECLNWPEDLLSLLCIAVSANDERSRKVRHRIARYINATYALAWRDISDKIRAVFPSVRDIVTHGLLTHNEYNLLQSLNDKESCPYTRWMTPMHWTQQILYEEYSKHDMPVALLNNFMGELKNFRVSFRRLFCHDWVCVPLVYTQVAAIATYGFFFFALFGRQHLSDSQDVDIIFPLFTVVQFLFYVGWYKVGLDLMRPFGTDDDDIELAYILERNINVSFAIVDKLQGGEPPEEEEDVFWKNEDRLHLRVEKNEEGKKMKRKDRAPQLHTLFQEEEKDKLNEDEDGRSRRMADVAELIIREERRDTIRKGLRKWIPVWKNDIPNDKRVFYW